nr:SPASM domain-containing protein [Bacteroidales bacterium]
DLENNNLDKNNIKIFVKPIRTKQNCTTDENIIEDSTFFNIELEFYKIAKEKGFYYSLHPNFNSDIRCIYHQLNSFAIDPQLNLYKCAEQIGLDSHKMGKINQEANIEINDIYEHSKMLMYNPNIIAECQNCKVLPICNGKSPIEWEKNQRKNDFGCIPEKKSINYKIEQLLKNEL